MKTESKIADASPYILFELHDAKDMNLRDAVIMGPYDKMSKARKDMIDCIADAVAWEQGLDTSEIRELKLQLSGKKPMPEYASFAAGFSEGISCEGVDTIHWQILEIRNGLPVKPRITHKRRPRWTVSDIPKIYHVSYKGLKP